MCVQRLRIVELTLDHEAPYFTNMRRRNSRKDRCVWWDTKCVCVGLLTSVRVCGLL